MTEKDILKLREARNGLLGRLSILKKSAEIALERLEEAERQRDEVQAACDALTIAINATEEDLK